MGGFADFLQGTANTLNSIGISTPELGLTELFGGSSVAPLKQTNLNTAYEAMKKTGGSGTGTNNSTDPYGNTNGINGGGGGGGYSAEDVDYIDDLIANYNRQMGRVDTGLGDARQSIESSYLSEKDKQTLAQNRAMRDFDTKLSDTELAKERAIGAVDTNARTLADSLRRRLGMAGGTDSSAFKFAAPQAVARQASGERTGVLTDYGQNFRNIDTARKDTDQDFQSLFEELSKQRLDRLSGSERSALEQKNQISTALANAAREKATIMGGGYSAARSASAPYTNDIASRETAIDNLFKQYNNPYTTRNVEAVAPSLKDYTVDRAAINANQGSASTYSPYEQLLKKRNEESVA